MARVTVSAQQLELTAHCLLRLTTALMLESRGIDHLHPSATDELNQRTGRAYAANQWLQIIGPAYLERFCPGEFTPQAPRPPGGSSSSPCQAEPSPSGAGR